MSGMTIMVGDRALFERGHDDARAAAAMFPNAGVHGAAQAFAYAHERAIQYLSQAPVLVLGAALGGPAVRRVNALYLQHKLVPLCERGAPLKEVMRAFHIAPPLRKLKPYAIFPAAGPVITALSGMDPAVLGRIVPDTPGLQRKWLIALGAWRERLAARRRSPDLHFSWAAEAISRSSTQRGDIGTVVDLLVATTMPDNAEARFSAAWGWPRAMQEAEAWHGRLNGAAAAKRIGLPPNTIIDLGTHPDEDTHDGLTFIALRTPELIAEEGAAMRHCVASYVRNVLDGHSHIVSIRSAGKRLATLELDGDWTVRQIKAKANRDPGGDARTAAAHYAFAIRKAMRQPTWGDQ